MSKGTLLLVLLIGVVAIPMPGRRAAVRVGSKKFTESVILGEMLRLLAEDAGAEAQHLRELGGTRLVFEALVAGEIDAYPEYTGTLEKELFADREIGDADQLRQALGERGIRMSRPLGFNNTYALGMLAERAERLEIETISDLTRHAELNFGFNSEFMERADGWPGLRVAYGLASQRVTGLDHDLAYRQLELGAVDVIEVYTTEARISALGLKILRDDRQYFPRYDAVLLYRAEAAADFGEAFASILRLEDQIEAGDMMDINRQVEIDGVSETASAAGFLADRFQIEITAREPTTTERIVTRTLEHLDLVRRSLAPAILLGIPLGVFAARRKWFGQVVLAVTGVIQTIPALALLVLLLPPIAWMGLSGVGAGSWTAVTALFLYSLLPIVRGTHSGLTTISPPLIESARALGISDWRRLTAVELPLASPSILAGVKTAAVINVGFATLGALVGAGGYGQPILSGIRLANTGLILEGAVPAALLALAVQAMFEGLEFLIVPRGLRLKPAGD